MRENGNRTRVKTIWRFARKYTPLFLVAEVCILVSYAVSLLLPLNLAKLTDEVLYNGRYEMLYAVIRNYVLLFFIATVFNLIYAFSWQMLNNLYVVDIKNEMFRKIVFAKAQFLINMNSGDMMSRIDNDADQFVHVIQRNLFHLINSFLLCCGIVIMVARIHTTIALMLIVAAVLPIVLTRFCGRFTEKYTKKSRSLAGALTGRLFELIKGFREIRLFGAELWARLQIETPLRELINLGNHMRRIDFFVNKGVYFVNLSVSLMIYGFSTFLIFKGEMTIGLFLAVVEYIALLHKKLNWMLRIYLSWHGRKVSIDRVNEVLSIPEESDEGIEIEDIESIEFRQVCFSYREDAVVLENVSFSIQKGEHVAVVGVSGVGKTTLIALLLGFYQATSGEILVNGICVSKIKPSSLRNAFGIASQDVVMFQDSVRHNLQMGMEHTDDVLWDILEETEMLHTVRLMSNGLDTLINSAGGELSAGQKQRLILARLLLRKPKFVILDEATSSLDVETEALILKRIRRLTEDATMMIISHRQAVVQHCNRIIVLEDKTVTTQDQPEEIKTCLLIK